MAAYPAHVISVVAFEMTLLLAGCRSVIIAVIHTVQMTAPLGRVDSVVAIEMIPLLTGCGGMV